MGESFKLSTFRLAQFAVRYIELRIMVADPRSDIKLILLLPQQEHLNVVSSIFVTQNIRTVVQVIKFVSQQSGFISLQIEKLGV